MATQAVSSQICRGCSDADGKSRAAVTTALQGGLNEVVILVAAL